MQTTEPNCGLCHTIFTSYPSCFPWMRFSGEGVIFNDYVLNELGVDDFEQSTQNLQIIANGIRIEDKTKTFMCHTSCYYFFYGPEPALSIIYQFIPATSSLGGVLAKRVLSDPIGWLKPIQNAANLPLLPIKPFSTTSVITDGIASVFHRIPPEIRQLVAMLLEPDDLGSFRLASRAIASDGAPLRYWRSLVLSDYPFIRPWVSEKSNW
ncbi:hypothetical protein F4821DRAFT_265814 [Hypoxylon rubiginosum]|uniref:Uncharacterized protein n=1 Tax=Hypoxylon rubiginosum TaxID=110542 RepID=A0ACC0CJL1_9PEZI|nr:hypothetical protein F4821DRAFT_265814 [Hypoxylon rubiginosum]